MSKYVCPNCGNDRFHEVGSVQTTTDVILEAGFAASGDVRRGLDADRAQHIVLDTPEVIGEQQPEKVKPTFRDYSDTGSQTIWDASDGYFIECSICLTEVECEGYPSRRPDDEALNEIHKLLDGREWSSDELPQIADILRRAGKPVRDPSTVKPCPSCGAMRDAVDGEFEPGSVCPSCGHVEPEDSED